MFDSHLACAASDATGIQCINGWLVGVGTVVPDDGKDFTRSLVGD